MLVDVECQVCHNTNVAAFGGCGSCSKGMLAPLPDESETFSSPCPYCDDDVEDSSFGGVDLDWSRAVRPKDLLLVDGSAMCARCENYEDMTIFRHSGEEHRVCRSCGSNTVDERIAQGTCDRCNQWWIGEIDLDDSSFLGCPMCDT